MSDEIEVGATAAEEVARAIQGSRPGGELESSILVGFIAVCEWSDASGTKWLSKLSADGAGDPERMTSWQERGYLNEVLNHWSYDYDEEDDE